MDASKIQVDEHLVDLIIRSTNAGLKMTGVEPVPVGISVLPARSQDLSVVIGLVGRRTGTVTLNVSQRATLYLASQFTGSELAAVDEEVFDAVGEITNIIAGNLKAELSTDDYQITNISCPSIVMGGDYLVHQRVQHRDGGVRALRVAQLVPQGAYLLHHRVPQPELRGCSHPTHPRVRSTDWFQRASKCVCRAAVPPLPARTPLPTPPRRQPPVR